MVLKVSTTCKNCLLFFQRYCVRNTTSRFVSAEIVVVKLLWPKHFSRWKHVLWIEFCLINKTKTMWKLTSVIISGLLPIELYRIFMRDHLMLSEMFAICVIFRHFVYFTYLHRLFFLVFFFFAMNCVTPKQLQNAFRFDERLHRRLCPNEIAKCDEGRERKKPPSGQFFLFFFNFFLSFVGHLRMCVYTNDACLNTQLTII